MAGHFMKSGRIGCVVVGADRIAANGDVANKIGTYSVAVLAKENGVPFYVAAPISTLDLTLASGDQIPIEQRAAAEVTHVFGHPVAPDGTAVAEPGLRRHPRPLRHRHHHRDTAWPAPLMKPGWPKSSAVLRWIEMRTLIASLLCVIGAVRSGPGPPRARLCSARRQDEAPRSLRLPRQAGHHRVHAHHLPALHGLRRCPG